MSTENIVEAAVVHKENERGKGIMALGQVLACDTGNRYLVESLLGAGRYGEVYKVALLSDPDKKYAIKVAEDFEKVRRLKTEALLFEKLQDSPIDIDKSRFVEMLHHGRTPTIRFFLMELTGQTLDELIGTEISPATLLQIARQTLQGIDALHKLGYVHRDIAPWYFAIGIPPMDHIVYLLDFGAAQAIDSKPRVRDNFFPSSRYASIAAMEEQNPTRRDDIAAWNYMMLELYDRKNLPWRDQKDAKAVLKAKKEQQKNWPLLTNTGAITAPACFLAFTAYIAREMKPDAKVDFRHLFKLLKKTADYHKINERQPLDWVHKRYKEQALAAVAAGAGKESAKSTRPPKQQDKLKIMHDLLNKDEKEDSEKDVETDPRKKQKHHASNKRESAKRKEAKK